MLRGTIFSYGLVLMEKIFFSARRLVKYLFASTRRFGQAGIICLILFSFVASSLPTQTLAASLSSISIANYLPIQNSKVEDGDIIISTPKGYFLSSVEYDPQVVGIVTSHPAISLKPASNEKTYPVVNIGTVYIKVSGMNGNIKKSDFITTSNIPGTGMKATRSGYVLGQALEDASFTKPTETKEVLISLSMHFLQLGSPIRNSLFDIFRLSTLATYEEPIKVFQYVIAAFIVVASFIFGFLIFARVINTGIEALGRNPLAGRMIQLSILFTIVLVIIILMTGIFLAYLLLRL